MIGRAATTVSLVTLCAVAPVAAGAAAREIVADLYRPALLLIAAGCYLIGLCLVAAAAFRLLRRAHDRFGPSLAGSALMVVSGSALIHLPAWLEALGATLFGPGRASRLVLSAAAPPAAAAIILDAIMALLFLIGVIAAARGLALLPAAADGRATPTQALCHLLGGAALCNFPALAGAVDAALGLELFRP